VLELLGFSHGWEFHGVVLNDIVEVSLDHLLSLVFLNQVLLGDLIDHLFSLDFLQEFHFLLSWQNHQEFFQLFDFVDLVNTHHSLDEGAHVLVGVGLWDELVVVHVNGLVFWGEHLVLVEDGLVFWDEHLVLVEDGLVFWNKDILVVVDVLDGLVFWGEDVLLVEDGLVLWDEHLVLVEDGFVFWGEDVLLVEHGLVLRVEDVLDSFVFRGVDVLHVLDTEDGFVFRGERLSEDFVQVHLLKDGIFHHLVSVGWVVHHGFFNWHDHLFIDQLDISNGDFLHSGEGIDNFSISGFLDMSIREHFDVSEGLFDLTDFVHESHVGVEVQVFVDFVQKEFVVGGGGSLVFVEESIELLAHWDLEFVVSVGGWVLLFLHHCWVGGLVVVLGHGLSNDLELWNDVLVEEDGVLEVHGESFDIPELLEEDAGDVFVHDGFMLIPHLSEQWDVHVTLEEVGLDDFPEGEDGHLLASPGWIFSVHAGQEVLSKFLLHQKLFDER